MRNKILGVKMTDYLKIYEKFNDVKEVKDYIDDVILLRQYYASQQFTDMQEHIRKLTIKHIAETIVWNTANPVVPQTIDEAYYNAENFLRLQGAKIIVETVKNYAQRLADDEKEFVEALIKKG
jgi:hypothetical protein